MKASKHRRKELNALRNLGEIPWPARKYTIAPTLGEMTAKQIEVGKCSRKVAEAEVKESRFKRKKTIDVPCSGRVFVKRGSLGKRRVYCEACRARKQQAAFARRFQGRLQRLSPREQIATQRREVSKFRRFLRKSAK